MARELLLDIDSYNKPKELKGSKADSQLLHNALMRRSDDTFIDGLAYHIQRFRFKELRESISTIQSTLHDYCRIYMPTINIANIEVRSRTLTSVLLVITVIDDSTHTTSNIVFDVHDDKDKLLVNLIK